MTVLATDLDGTLIPLARNNENLADLAKLAKFITENKLQLVFVTGRHLSSILTMMTKVDLPTPDWIIANVGTEIYENKKNAKFDRLDVRQFLELEAYRDRLDQNAGGLSVEKLAKRLTQVEGLTLQENEKQSRHKLSYYCDAKKIERLMGQIYDLLPSDDLGYDLIASVDPFTGDGLLDLLPKNANKSYALNFWCQQQTIPVEQLIFAGDSGNDLHALTAGFCAILVSNAADDLRAEIRSHHQKEFGSEKKLFCATRPATSGVLQGLQHFVEDEATSPGIL